MLVGLATIVWSLGFIDRPNGHRVLLLLGGLLFLVGGGIGMLVFLVSGWAVARRIGRPLAWVRSRRPGRLTAALHRAWPGLVALGLAAYAFALEVAIVGYVPGVSDPDLALSLCWLALLACLVAMFGALVGASVADTARDRDRLPARPMAAPSR
jgi:hypothetical protein